MITIHGHVSTPVSTKKPNPSDRIGQVVLALAGEDGITLTSSTSVTTFGHVSTPVSIKLIVKIPRLCTLLSPLTIVLHSFVSPVQTIRNKLTVSLYSFQNVLSRIDFSPGRQN